MSSPPRSAVILGAGGTALDLLAFLAAGAAPDLRPVGLLDDDPAKQGTRIGGVPVLGPLAHARELHGVVFLDALGSPRSFRRRSGILAELDVAAERFASLVHPLAVVAGDAVLGPGCILYPFVMIGPQVRLGRNVTVLSHSVVHHESTVGDFCILASGVLVSGGVRIGASAYLGAGSSVIQGGEVGEEALVGMGSAVIRPVAPRSVVVGTPARPLDAPR